LKQYISRRFLAGEEGFARLRAGRVAALGLLRLAVPEESFGLTLFLRFFDRCSNPAMPSPATGSGIA